MKRWTTSLHFALNLPVPVSSRKRWSDGIFIDPVWLRWLSSPFGDDRWGRNRDIQDWDGDQSGSGNIFWVTDFSFQTNAPRQCSDRTFSLLGF
jgi:hypothetical protein